MNKKIVSIIILAVVILGFAFYWFQLRPSQISKESTELGLLEGSVTYLGPYPTPAPVNFTTKDGENITITVFPGQVQVFFNSLTTDADATEAIQTLGGTVLSKIPKIQYYMAGVAPGKESSFITSILSLPIIESATPHIVAQLKKLIELADLTEYCKDRPKDILCTTVPLNVKPGVVVIDSNFLAPNGHGYKMVEANTNNGGTIGSLVNLPTIKCTIQKCGFDGEAISTDMTVKTIAAAAEGNSRFNPGKPLIVNLSMNGVESRNKDGTINEKETLENIKGYLSLVLEGISKIPTDIRNKGLIVTIALGNEKLDLTQVLADIRENAELAEAMSKHAILVGTEQYDGSNYITGKDKDVVISNNAEAKGGTSGATAAVSALIDQLIRKGFTIDQIISALKSADDIYGQLTLDEALSVLSSIPILTPTSTPTPGAYTGPFSGTATETYKDDIDDMQWKNDVSATVSIAVSGNGTLIDPYKGSMKVEGSCVISLVYCYCRHAGCPGCDPGGTVALSGIGTVSGSLGKVEASSLGAIGTGTFTASFTGGTFTGNTLIGTFTFDMGADAPIVKTITLTK